MVSDVSKLADQAIDEIRTMSYLLHPPLLDEAGFRCAAEKVIKVKADVAALLYVRPRDISREKFVLGSLRSDDWQLGRPIASPLLSVFP
jgi:hypothetical protein